MTFEWFSTIDTQHLEQGDIFFRCDVITSVANTDAPEDLDAELKTFDVIVLSQSCDLAHRKIEHALVCPHWTVEALGEALPRFANPKELEHVRQGNVPGFHMINACAVQGFTSSVRVVSFRQLYAVPVSYLAAKANVTPRLRLLPPYREQLAQAFARYFMRVGLPIDIPQFS